MVQDVRKIRRTTARIGATLACLLAAAHAQAASNDFPSRPLRLLTPYGAGGNADIMARIVAQGLAENLGVQVVVDNRPGANGIIGTEMAVKALPDGYTMVLVASSIAANPTLVKQLPYDTQRDLAPVSMVGSVPLLLAAFPGVPANTVKELLALAKGKPGQLNYASSGNGSPANLAGELFNFMGGVKITHVPYKATAQAMTDQLGGHIQLSFPSMTAALPHVKSGKLKALGMTGLKRSALAPDVPTVAESGVPGYQANIWNGILVPAATPKPLIAKLNAEIVRVQNSAESRERFTTSGADAASSTPEEFRAFLAAEIVKWAKVIRDTGMRTDLER